MWVSAILAIVAIILLVNPKTRQREGILIFSSIAVFLSLWIEKGLGLVVTGYIPSPLDKVTEYLPTVPEILIALGVYGIGALIITILYKIVISIRDTEVC